MADNLPTFIIIGAMKCGTSGLYHSIIQHPNILGAKVKELRFWSNDKKYSKGLKLYSSYFPEIKEGQITCEASPSYILYPKVAKRMAKEMPNLKLVVMLRNPADRAFSQYKHYILNCQRFNRGKQLSFEEILDVYCKDNDFKKNHSYWMGKDILERGIYIKYLKEWFKYFHSGQIYIIKSEEYFKYPVMEIDRLLSWLGLKFGMDYFTPEIKNPNASKNPLKMDEFTRAQLLRYFCPYNVALYKMLGKDFQWEELWRIK